MPKHTRTPTAVLRDARRPAQMRAQVFLERLLVAMSALVAEMAPTAPEGLDESPLTASNSSEFVVREAFAFGKVP